jgi:uncharacterized protein (TIGR02996 family)
MTDEPGFLAQLCDQPHDDTTRLIYADWLEEQGDARAEYLRLEVQVAALDEWSDDCRAKEQQLAHLAKPLSQEWLELVGKRYDVWMVDRPTNLLPVVSTLYQIGLGIAQAIGLVGQLPTTIVQNKLRGSAAMVRDRLLTACQLATGGPLSEMPIRLRPAEHPRPMINRFPAPGDPPGYALRLLKCPTKGRGSLTGVIQSVTEEDEEKVKTLLAGELPCTLRTFAKPEEARNAARLFKNISPVEVRYIDPHAGRVLDRPLVAKFSVVLNSYPEAVKRQLIEILSLMMGCSTKQARSLLNRPLPMVLRSGITWEDAEALRLALPARAWVEVREDTE